MYDIVIVGGGTAGLSAAVYASRAGKKVLLLEKKACGGQILNSPRIENYPAIRQISGFDFATALYEQAKAFGTDMKFEEVDSLGTGDRVKIVATRSAAYKTKTVILACGASARKLELSGEEKFIGHGVSYCAECDGAFFKGKTVAVAGGGDTALDEAALLSEICLRVYLIHRRSTFRGNPRTLEKLRQKGNVEIITNTVVSGLYGDRALKSIRLSDAGSTEILRDLAVEGLFVAIGQVPDTKAFRDFVQTDEAGYFEAGEDCETNVPGIFAAGDCRHKRIRQLSTAASDGVTAALGAIEYIRLFN